MRTDKERAYALWSAFPPSCSGPTSCPVDLTVTVQASRTHNRCSTLGDPCSLQARPPPEECCWWEILIYPSHVCPQIWRCSVNTSWHLRLATDIRNAAVFLCHVDLSQKSLWLQRPHRPVKNRSTTERHRPVLMLARQQHRRHNSANLLAVGDYLSKTRSPPYLFLDFMNMNSVSSKELFRTLGHTLCFSRRLVSCSTLASFQDVANVIYLGR